MNTVEKANSMRIKLFCLLTSALAMMATHLMAQVFTTLYSFPAADTNSANAVGAFPMGDVILSGNTLYGTAQFGGRSGNGTVFSVNTDGAGFTTLHVFTGGSDGCDPLDGVILSGDTLYGTADEGGSAASYGTVFAVETNGTGFTTVHTFHGANGEAWPYGGLVLSGNTLYGTALGPENSSGAVFVVNTDGTGWATLHTFEPGSTNASGPYTNSDGAWPSGSLLLSGNTLYGTAVVGGQYGCGTVFAINTDGTGFTSLHVFRGSDGASPYGGLILSGNTLYGAAFSGGSTGNGTVFALNTDGTAFTTLHSFTATSTNSSGFCVNTDGAAPYGALILSGDTLYGTAQSGGSSGSGTLFAINTDGTGFTTLYCFTPLVGSNSTNRDGASPDSNLVLSGNTLYGTAYEGGVWGSGTVFSLLLAPQPAVIRSGGNVILTWPTNCAGFDYSGYTLQSTTNLGSSAVWRTNSSAPVVVNGQNTVTNPITGTQQFFRLGRQ
jgi:uncharacterized repeat protein (TIGR03803 family)